MANIDVQSLLDASTKTAHLRAFAYLEASYSSGASTMVDCFLPFLIVAVKHHNGEIFNAQEISSFVKDEFSIEAPIYMVQQLARRLENDGHIKRNSLTGAFSCDSHADLREGIPLSISLSTHDIDSVAERLETYAHGRGLPAPLSSDSWSIAIISFFLHKSDEEHLKSAELHGALLSYPKSIDDFIVGEFILQQSSDDKSLFEMICRIFYGVLVNDFWVTIGETGRDDDFVNLNVIYDSTALMRLLGTSGKYHKIASLELHETLRNFHCNTFYFDHTLPEVQANLDNIVSSVEAHRPVFPETRDALRNGEISLTQIKLLCSTVDSALGRLGIFGHKVTYETSRDNPHQIDEERFVEFLGTPHNPRYDVLARQTDAKSLALVNRLRRGNHVKDIAKCKHVFVTHNYFFTRKVKEFLVDEGEIALHVPGPMVAVEQMTTVSWLAKGIKFDQARVSVELIANCFSAVSPSRDWEDQLWKAIRKERDVGEEDFQSINLHFAEEIARSESFGNARILANLSMADILERADNEAERRRESARMSGYQAGERAAMAAYDDHVLIRADRYAEITVTVLRYLAIVVGGLLIPLSFFNLENQLWKWPVIVVSSLVAILSLYSIVEDRTPFRPMARLQQSVQRLIVNLFKR